jgi:DNA-directed RNA polymerase subunit M/transcription elongation factor TFIIS
MKFCTRCENLLNLKSSEESETLQFYCNFCNLFSHEDEKIDKDYVFFKKRNEDKAIYTELNINQFVVEDKTLPVLKNYNCKNNCNSDVIYIECGSEKLDFIYQCKSCLSVWRRSS